MRSVFSLVLMTVVLFSGIQSVMAQAEAKKAKKGDAMAQFFAMPKGIELTAEQETKAKEIQKTMGDKAKEAQAKVDAVLSPELKKKASEARKTASEAGKKGKDLETAVNEALGLSAEQQEALKAANKAVTEVKNAYYAELSSILTAEQKEKLPKTGGKKEKK